LKTARTPHTGKEADKVATSWEHVQIQGQSPVLVERLEEPLHRALAERPGFYRIYVDSVGRVGEVLVSITGSRGRVPLIFAEDELEPGYVVRVVKDTLAKFGF
jgi:hypothetical protein